MRFHVNWWEAKKPPTPPSRWHGTIGLQLRWRLRRLLGLGRSSGAACTVRVQGSPTQGKLWGTWVGVRWVSCGKTVHSPHQTQASPQPWSEHDVNCLFSGILGATSLVYLGLGWQSLLTLTTVNSRWPCPTPKPIRKGSRVVPLRSYAQCALFYPLNRKTNSRTLMSCLEVQLLHL